jgi:hypothetical protein
LQLCGFHILQSNRRHLVQLFPANSFSFDLQKLMCDMLLDYVRSVADSRSELEAQEKVTCRVSI